VNQILLCAEVPLGRPDGCVAQKQLNLFEFATAGGPAQLRRRAPQVMGRDACHSRRRGVRPEELPHDLLRQALAPQLVAAVRGPEHEAVR